MMIQKHITTTACSERIKSDTIYTTQAPNELELLPSSALSSPSSPSHEKKEVFIFLEMK